MLLVATALGLRLWWGWHVEKQLAAQQAEIRRRGEPLDVSEVRTDPVPGAQNVFVLVRKAARLDNGLSPSNTQLEYPAYPPFGPAWERAARASETANAGVFPLARQARCFLAGDTRRRRHGPCSQASAEHGN